MRSLRTLLAAGLASAAAVEAPVYTFGPSSHQATGRPPSISAANARLYLAQRLGLSQFESLGLADNTTLQLLNTERVGQIPLFSDAGEQDTRRSLIIVEDIEDAERALDYPTSYKHFLIRSRFLPCRRQALVLHREPTISIVNYKPLDGIPRPRLLKEGEA